MAVVKDQDQDQSQNPDPVKVNPGINGSPSVVVEPAVEPVVKPELTLTERIQRVEDLSILVEKRAQLQASLREISTFKLSTDSMSNRVTLRNVGTQREFNTSNSEVIGEIIDVIVAKIESKLREVESQIVF